MASVSSLDKDLRSLRLDKYTPQRANECRQWIEDTLGERLRSGDLLEALKDGIALCKLVNLAAGTNVVRFKESSMPFVQMENISHFLRTCQLPPLSLPAHDVFLTVDLYESKDPAQVLQCIESFSRRASAIQPGRIPKALGKFKPGLVSPQRTGASPKDAQQIPRERGGSNASETNSASGGRVSPFKQGTTSPSSNSSWAKKTDIGSTAPAWNIAQYGWTGGASQGNQGISFGARRQITTQAPSVPSLAEKERRRREQEAEAKQQREAAEEIERLRLAEQERLEAEKARRWEEEARKRKEVERREAEEEKRRWEEEERRWREEEEAREKEEKEAESRLEKEHQQRQDGGESLLKGQYLSQYQAEQRHVSSGRERIKELEAQLEEARERERQYQHERQGTMQSDPAKDSSTREKTPEAPPPAPQHGQIIEEDSWHASEREELRQEWEKHASAAAPSKPPRPLPIPQSDIPAPPPRPNDSFAPARPLPDPAAYKASTTNRTDRFLASNVAPALADVASHVPPEAALSSTAEREKENSRRVASQTSTKAGGWASKSLLEREMEQERARQREWEEAQRETQSAVARGAVDKNAGPGPGQSWDVNTYGFTGGDNLNNSGGGVYSGRRQIIGPRPLGSKGT